MEITLQKFQIFGTTRAKVNNYKSVNYYGEDTSNIEIYIWSYGFLFEQNFYIALCSLLFYG